MWREGLSHERQTRNFNEFAVSAWYGKKVLVRYSDSRISDTITNTGGGSGGRRPPENGNGGSVPTR